MYSNERHPNLVLKLNVPYALKDGEKIALDYAPARKADGTVLIPSFIEGFGGKSEDFEGKKYFALESLDANKKFDEMGCIILDKEIPVEEINREDDLDLMLHWMGEFIFDFEKIPMQKSYAPATPEERAGFKRVGADIRARLEARGNKHPYLVSKPGILDTLHEIYKTGSNPTLKGYMEKLVANADEFMKKDMYRMNADMTALLEHVKDPQDAGYNEGKRAHFQEGLSATASQLAIAYQFTRDVKYAKLAYLILNEMIRIPHWGPAHFLNNSISTYNYCFTYDWLYNIWCELGYELQFIYYGIYSHGVLQSINSVIYDKCDHPTPYGGAGRFKLKPDNWNAVCNMGSIVGAAMLICDGKMGYVTDGTLDMCAEQIGASLSSLTQDGLVLKQYATDGSYVESNSYWSYGTSSLFKTLGALHSLLGTDLGLHYTWGLDKTCYYAVQTESAEYVGWNYHDGNLGAQGTGTFYLYGYISGDRNLYALRREQLKRGKASGLYDILYDPELLGEEIPALQAMPLDYHMESIDGFTVRSGWERGSIYAGLLGGKNPIGSSHQQIDAGCFVYHNHGKLWFTDLGSDNYNLPGGYFSNNNLFRRNAEGNNTLFLTSLPHGQALNTNSPMIEHKSSDAASYAIVDTTAAYGDKAIKALRGMLLTADRTTWILHDEVELAENENAIWAANFESARITAEISEDGKKCHMSYEDGAAIDVYLFAEGAKFEIVGCYDFLLEQTQRPVEGEYPRDNYSRLIVRFDDIKKIDCTIVVEPVGDAAKYTTPMCEWKNI